MPTFTFRPSARLQRYLGRELIADPNLAIIEFVKNAYDAGAENVYVSFELTDPSETSLTISDDGSGMDAASFERNWMHPGYSEKAALKRSRGGRVPTGEKGLGRLAAGRLGETLNVYTRNSRKSTWLHVAFRWADFDDMSRMLDQVRVPYDQEEPPPEPRSDVGTVLVIKGLSLKWDGRMRGRPLAGRSSTRLGRLKQDLRLLLRPLPPEAKNFAVHLDSDSFLDPDDIGTVTPTEAVVEADYIYEFALHDGKRGPVVTRELRRQPRIAAEFHKPRRTSFGNSRLRDIADIEGRPPTLESGSFSGRFLYTPPPAAKRAKEVDAVGSGVLLYRDGVLVEPYGMDGDDWVGVAARKAQRQGYALVQPATFSGYVLIGRDTNRSLRDMSNRQGLIANEASESLVAHVRAEFRFFEEQVFEELKQRWRSIEEQAAEQAEESVDLAAVRLRAIAHSLGQPLLGLAADASALRSLASQEGIQDDVRAKLRALATSEEAHIQQAERVVSRFRSIRVPDRTRVSVAQLMQQAIAEVRPLAKSLGVTLRCQKAPGKAVLVHAELMVEAIRELIRNALEATPPGKTVSVSYHDESGDLVVDIVDQGPGLAGVKPGDELAPVPSTKGRTGEGISTVVEITHASRARVMVAKSGPEGTHIELRLPDLLRGLRG